MIKLKQNNITFASNRDGLNVISNLQNADLIDSHECRGKLHIYSISLEICTRFLLCCALLWLYID